MILLPDRLKAELSFLNLVEAHVLDALRRQHGLSLQSLRKAADYLRREFKSEHPFAEHSFVTDGVSLLLERFENLVNVSRDGQTELEQVLHAHLRRIDRDNSGRPFRLYPFTYRSSLHQPKAVVIDPTIAFGRPVLANTGIPTAIIAERLKAGESIDALAADYERPREEIEDAIRCELKAA